MWCNSGYRSEQTSTFAVRLMSCETLFVPDCFLLESVSMKVNAVVRRMQSKRVSFNFMDKAVKGVANSTEPRTEGKFHELC